MLQVVRKHKILNAGTRPREVGVFKNLESSSKARSTGLTYKNRLTGLIPIASSFTLLGILSLSSVAYADNTLTLNATVGDQAMTVNVSQSMVNLSVRPGATAPGTASGSVNVLIDAPSNYNLYMYSDQTALTSSTTNTPIAASTCESNCTLSGGFSADTWGYNVNGTSETAFGGFGGFDTILENVSNSTTSTNITFGVKVSTATNPGEYSNTLRFVAVTTAASSSTLEMQDMDINDCPANGRVLATDTRDYSVYTIQKLADGNCWMLDNLALGSTTTAYNLTPNDTNITANWTLPISSAGSAWEDSYILPYINAKGECTTGTSFACSESNSGRVGGYNKNSDVLDDPVFNDNEGGKGYKKIGVYYNYCAASAGTYCLTSTGANPNDPETEALTSNDNGNRSITGDICPKGWRLPIVGSSGEFQLLYNAYLQAAPNNDVATARTDFKIGLATPLSGRYFGGAARDQGVVGSFWSSTRHGASTIYGLSVYASEFHLPNNDYRYLGRSVRCVLNQN